MRLLVVVSSIYDENLFKERKTITGIEIMVRDILDGISNEVECSVFTTSLKSKGQKIGKIQLLPNDCGCLYRLLRRTGLDNFRRYFHELKGRRYKERFNLAASMVLLDYHISQVVPDIVNIHDLNDWNTFFVQKILPKGVNVLLTDHLYIGKKARTYGYNSLRNNEEIVFNSRYENLSISFVSTGMRERFLGDYPTFPKDKVYCVVNGTNISRQSKDMPRRPKIFNKMHGKKILLCIGSFTPRKNQQAIIDAFRIMTQDQKDKVCVLFIGARRKQILKDYIHNKRKTQSLFYTGKVSPLEMESYYYYCDGTITTSLNESFGLTIIEGFSYGKPAIIFNDIDSYKDLYNKEVCVPINEHNSEAIITAINELTNHNWDGNYIRKYVMKFSMDRVNKEYMKVYKSIKLP